MLTAKEILNPENKDYRFNYELADNIYLYGSRVYGTHNKESDFDYIVVANIEEDRLNEKDLIIYSRVGFQDAINRHEISALECLFLPAGRMLKIKKTIDFNFELDLSKLRHSISKKASNSWVKCKKKLTVAEDFDAYIGKKSLFHSLRIISFGKQLAEWGEIRHYDSMNYLYGDIVHHPSCDWEYYKKTYKPLYNKMMSEFRLLAPK